MVIDPQSEATSQNLAHVLDTARATLDGEFARANRLDEKARGQATLAGSWFAVTQAVSAIATGTSASKGWIIGLAVGLGLQAVTLLTAWAAPLRGSITCTPRAFRSWAWSASSRTLPRMAVSAACT